METRFVTDAPLEKVNQIKRSVYVEGREWFDRSGGNTYFTARVWVDGQLAATLPFQYGYGLSYVYEAASVLKDMGFLPDDTSALWTLAQDMGFDFYKSIATVNKNQLFKEAK
jgi:hypothetical protein